MSIAAQQRAAREALGPWFREASKDPSPVGQTLIVSGTQDGKQALLMRAHVGVADERAVSWQSDAEDAWNHSKAAVPHSLPVLWGEYRQLTRSVPALQPASSWSRRGAAPQGVWTIEGNSCGVAFAMALASATLNLPLATDFVATATVSRTGRIGIGDDGQRRDVGGLRAKACVILMHAPGVRRIVVSNAQLEDADAAVHDARQILREEGQLAAAERPLTVRGYECLDAVLEDVLGDISEAWTLRGTTKADRASLAKQLFLFVLDNKQDCARWLPVAQASSIALSTWNWTESEQVEQFRLAFAESVARRYGGDAVPHPVPSAETELHLSNEHRQKVLAHLLQSWSLAGQELDDATLKHVSGMLDGGGPLDQAQLRMVGARARGWLTWGHAERCLNDYVRAAEAWLTEYGDAASASYGLTVALWLARELRDAPATTLVDDLTADALLKTGQDSARPSEYFASALIRVACLDGDLERAWELYMHLARVHSDRVSARASALRQIARASAPGSRADEQAEKALQELLQLSATDNTLVRFAAAMLAADRATQAKNPRAAIEALDEAERHWSKPLAPMRASYRLANGDEDVARVLGLFPY